MKKQKETGLITFEQLKQACFNEYGFEDDEEIIELFENASNVDELLGVLDDLGYDCNEEIGFVLRAILK